MLRHFTATVYVIKEDKALLLYHKKLEKWLPPGGHVEDNETPPECARREALEETGLIVEIIKHENIWLCHANAESIERPYLCLVENIPPYGDTPAHQHIDMVFVGRPIGGSEDRSLTQEGKLRWFDYGEIEQLRSESDIFQETKNILKHILLDSSFTRQDQAYVL